MRAAIAIALILILCSTCSAQPKHFYTDWKWWVGEGLIVGSLVADSRSTIVMRDRCPTCVEHNPILGKRPSHGEIIGLTSAGIAIETVLHAEAWNLSHDDPQRGWRVFGAWALPVAAVAINGRSAVNNYHLIDEENRRVSGLARPMLPRH